MNVTEERDALRRFAQKIMEAWPTCDVDGADLQEIAIECGILEPSQPTQEEMDEEGLEPFDPWYRKTLLLMGGEAQK